MTDTIRYADEKAAIKNDRHGIEGHYQEWATLEGMRPKGPLFGMTNTEHDADDRAAIKNDRHFSERLREDRYFERPTLEGRRL